MQWPVPSKSLVHQHICADDCRLQLATKQRAPPCDTFGVDLSKSDKVCKFAKDVLDKYKNVDILVNNAGMGPSSGSGPIKGEHAPVSQTCRQV